MGKAEIFKIEIGERSAGEGGASDRLVAGSGAVIACCCGSVCALITIGLCLLPIANIVIGALYLEDCPLDDKIPIFLVVSGSVSVGKAVIKACSQYCLAGDDDGGICLAVFGVLDVLLNLFLFSWFICGSVWVYSTVNTWQHDDVTADNYCQELCFLYAFWFLNVIYLLLGVAMVLGLCGVCVALVCGLLSK